MRRRLIVRGLAISGVLALALGVASCGDDGDSGTSDATTTTTDENPPGVDGEGQVVDAEVVRDELADLIENLEAEPADEDALAEAIAEVYPSLTLVDSTTTSTPTEVSSLVTTFDDSSVAGTDNPQVVALGVTTTEGGCVGAVVFGYPALDNTVTVEITTGNECTAESVYESGSVYLEP